MFHFQHKTLIIFSGLVWLIVGCFLLPLGLTLIADGAQKEILVSSSSLPLLQYLARGFGGMEQASVFLIAMCLGIGFFKGRYVLSKSVNRLVNRIRSFPNPTHFSKIYSPAYLLLLGSMVLLGMVIRYFHVSNDIRGAIDVIIGAALINGSLLYFRMAFSKNYL